MAWQGVRSPIALLSYLNKTKQSIMSKQVQIVETVRNEVSAILLGMQGISKEKAGKLVVKSFGIDKKFNAWLNADFSKGLTVFTQKEKRERLLKAVESWGITDTKRKQALIIAMAEADIQDQVREKVAEVTLEGKLPMSEEQKAQHERQIIAYGQFLAKDMNAGIADLGVFLGAFEEVKEVKPELVAA
ncbi:MAG: hypothetical protein KGQ83_09690 [Planctomycetes bacterium]|nr:hypothetical protein [Planctomycetota bacterium]